MRKLNTDGLTPPLLELISKLCDLETCIEKMARRKRSRAKHLSRIELVLGEIDELLRNDQVRQELSAMFDRLLSNRELQVLEDSQWPRLAEFVDFEQQFQSITRFDRSDLEALTREIKPAVISKDGARITSVAELEQAIVSLRTIVRAGLTDTVYFPRRQKKRQRTKMKDHIWRVCQGASLVIANGCFASSGPVIAVLSVWSCLYGLEMIGSNLKKSRHTRKARRLALRMTPGAARMSVRNPKLSTKKKVT